LKILDKLKKIKGQERQIETKHITTKATTMPFNTLALLLTKVNPFAGIKVLLLFLKV
jgi:hypothetical protein